jgi:hypothetical protein
VVNYFIEILLPSGSRACDDLANAVANPIVEQLGPGIKALVAPRLGSASAWLPFAQLRLRRVLAEHRAKHNLVKAQAGLSPSSRRRSTQLISARSQSVERAKYEQAQRLMEGEGHREPSPRCGTLRIASANSGADLARQEADLLTRYGLEHPSSSAQGRGAISRSPGSGARPNTEGVTTNLLKKRKQSLETIFRSYRSRRSDQAVIPCLLSRRTGEPVLTSRCHALRRPSSGPDCKLPSRASSLRPSPQCPELSE